MGALALALFVGLYGLLKWSDRYSAADERR
jgi:hypothetical protein